MTNFKSIGKQVEDSLKTLPDWTNLDDFVREFQMIWRKIGLKVQQQLVQSQIEEIEAQYQGARTKRTKRYYTPLGEMSIKRRAYSTPNGLEVFVDQELGLPQEKWLPQVLELASALGVSSEFPNSHQLFQQWTGIEITEKTLANQVEAAGQRLQQVEFNREKDRCQPRENSSQTSLQSPPERLYVGVDGVMTPLNQNQGYKEAKVGVVFWSKDHQKIKGKRGVIRHREYVATLKSRVEFRARVAQLYHQVVREKKTQTVVLGDGAHWIWEMAEEQFPGSVEILDFFHLSEYVWDVAKAAYPNQEVKQKEWVNFQQQLLKKSQGRQVIKNSQHFRGKKKELREAITDLERYLTNNCTRIDYQRYLKEGLMIGSGVVESSNRRVVTQRLKQAGMHWSGPGAEGVMALRAAYLSSSNRWANFWSDNNQVS